MLSALRATTKTVAYAFLLSVAIGFSLGLLVGGTKFGEPAVLPYLVAIDTMPSLLGLALYFTEVAAAAAGVLEQVRWAGNGMA